MNQNELKAVCKWLNGITRKTATLEDLLNYINKNNITNKNRLLNKLNADYLTKTN